MRKSVVVIVSLLIMLIANTALAFQLNQPEYLGWYSNARGNILGKAHADGYTKATKDAFVFGSGEEALIFQYENHYYNNAESYSKTKAVYVGKHLIPIKTYGFSSIYRITSQDGRTFYLGEGGIDCEQVFYLIGKCEDSYWNVITIDALTKFIKDIEFTDYNYAKHLDKPYTQGDKIIVPYYIENKKEKVTMGRFVFTWDPQVKWFGITLE